MRRWGRSLAWCVTAALIAGVVGCGSGAGQSGSSSSKAVVPPVQMARTVWSTTEGIDVFDRHSELVRAGFEAGRIYTYRLRDDAVFPGYFDARDTRALEANTSIAPWWGAGVIDSPKDEYAAAHSTYFAHLVTLEGTEDTVTGRVCAVDAFGPDYDKPPTPRSGAKSSTDGYTGSIQQITFQRVPGHSAGLAGIVDTGQRIDHEGRSPDWNVFDGWRITDVKGDMRTSGNTPTLARVTDMCSSWYRGLVAELGLPAHYSPLYSSFRLPYRQQFPRWIGVQDPT